MSGLSDAAMALTRAIYEDEGGKTRGKVAYEVVVADTRSDTTLITLRFESKAPINEEELRGKARKAFTKLTEELAADAAADVGAKLLTQYGFEVEGAGQNILRKRTTGSVNIVYDETGVGEDGVSAGIQTARGKLISQKNLRFLLNLVMKEYMLKEMTSPSAGKGRNTPLRNRTGRFVNSAVVDKISLINTPSKRQKQKLSLYFNYMIYPYQVFDPRRSSREALASKARDPVRIIGEALAKAARDLVLEKAYSIEVRQI